MPNGYIVKIPKAHKREILVIFESAFSKKLINLFILFTLHPLLHIVIINFQEVVIMSDKKVAVSGGFDPVHVGHIRMILEAGELGDVIVIANSDAWLMRKKGYVFMPWEERAEILASIRGVTAVVEAKDHDNTVCETLEDLKDTTGLDYFANGGDRKQFNTPEMEICEKIGVQMVWNCGGSKIQSSSELVERQKSLVNS